MTSPDTPAAPAQPSRPELTDQQIGVLVRLFVRTYVEVERGIRSPDQLRGYCTPECYRQLRRPDQPRHTREGPVLPGDLGKTDASRSGRTIHASVPTREHDDRWGGVSLTMQLDERNRIMITGLERIRQRELDQIHYPSTPPDLDQRLRNAIEERELVERAAEASRLLRDDDTLPPEQRDHHAEHASYWRDRMAALDREIAELRERRGLRTVADVELKTDPAAAAAARLLGPLPADPALRTRYGNLVRDIRDYRQQWRINDATTLLGPEPEASHQRELRSEITARIRSLADEMSRDPVPGGNPARERQTPSLER